jgi:hypothetical protein
LDVASTISTFLGVSEVFLNGTLVLICPTRTAALLTS